MSDEALLNMDEGTLRKLLEATLDLAKRRQIRSAIRELCRQQLEREEEALASKRSRTERSAKRQENKENWLREEQQQQRSLDALSRKLESVQDVEELTSLLRGASEYEERKLIRAAIRKLRAEEIEAVTLAGKAYNIQRGSMVAPVSKGPEENTEGEGHLQVQKRVEQEGIRAPIREQTESKETGGPGSLGTLLFFGPVPSQPPPEPSSYPKSRAEPTSTDEVPMGASDEDDAKSDQQLLPSSAAASKEGGPGIPVVPEGREVLSSSEGEPPTEPSSNEHHNMDVVVAREEASLEEPSCPRFLSQKGEIIPRAPEMEAGAAERGGDAALEVAPCGAPKPLQAFCDKGTQLPKPRPELGQDQPFQRAASVRERARKLNAGAPNPPAAPLKGESVGRGRHVPLQPQPQLFQHAAHIPLKDHAGSGSPATPAPQDGSRLQAGSGGPEAARTSIPQTKAGSVRLPAAAGPKEAGAPRGRNHSSQWQEKQLPSAQPPFENLKGGSTGSEGLRSQSSISARSPPLPLAPHPGADPDGEMKTLLTIEIKDGRHQPLQSRVVAAPRNQQAELTLGLRASPVRITTSSYGGGSTFKKMEAKLPGEVALPNGTEKERARSQQAQQPGRLSAEELSRIEEEDVLDKMLDQATDFEERRLIRAAMRDLRQRKRDQREKERNQWLQEAKTKGATQTTETTARQSTTSADGSAVRTVTQTQRLLQSNDGSRTSRTLTMEASYVKRAETDGNTFVQTKSYSSSSSKKVGSIFEREDESPGRGSGSSLAALERRQAEKKRELVKAQSGPKASASQARKAMIEKLEKEGGSPANPALSRLGVQRSSGFGVPNANSIKQMLLDWCRAKTRGYEHVDIQNFSSSWSNGMAFCALVHNFFPEAFDYAQLSPQDRRHNFEMAFSAAETHAECPQLLDVEDMVRMREPDWKCVYTYIQEFYRCLVQKGLVKTKKS